jgi:hypothetical protein
MLHEGGLGAHGLWSISRGLARGLSDRGEYKMEMDSADTPQKGALEGPVNLSLAALERWVIWFARIVLDQVTFMGELFDLSNLKGRLFDYAERDMRLRPEAKPLLAALLLQGEVARGAVAGLTGLGERTARELIRQIQGLGLVRSSSPKGPLFLVFGSESADALFPRLFPAQG